MDKKIFFDYAAAAPPLPEAADFYHTALMEDFYNQEALHSGAYALRRRQEEAAAELSQALFPGRAIRNVIWENNATALFNLLADSPLITGKQILSSALEHPALAASLKRSAARVSYLKTDKNGRLSPCSGDGTAFGAVCIHQVQSELGVIQDAEAVFSSVPGGVRVLDAVQAAGKTEVFPDADITVISGAKFGSPCGSAMLIDPAWKGAEKLLRFYADWRSRFYRGGRIPYAVAATLAFTAALRRRRMDDDLRRVSEVNRIITDGALRFGLRRTVAEHMASPYILHFILPSQQGAVVARMLSEHGILAASGSACAAESKEPSPALLALGMSREAAYRGLRLSFGAETSTDEAEKLLAALEKVLKNF